MRTLPHRRGQRYSAREKEEALQLLEQNDRNFRRTAEETGITVMTLQNWAGQVSQELPIVQSEEVEKFIKDAWENIHSLNDPKFIKKLKAQALDGKKSNLKEVFAAVSILVREVRFQSKVSKGAESPEFEENLTEEELEKEIAEEEKKVKGKDKHVPSS